MVDNAVSKVAEIPLFCGMKPSGSVSGYRHYSRPKSFVMSEFGIIAKSRTVGSGI